VTLTIKQHALLQIPTKGSSYGQARKMPSSHSFQKSTRGNRFLYCNRTQVLSNETTKGSQVALGITTSWHVEK
jgi:hypothetical protein